MRRACALVFALLPCAAAAAEIPACGPATAGAVTCMAGRMCACAYERPGRMTGTPGGWRWDCGILRPACGGGPEVPATTSAGPTPWWPGSLEVELTPRRRPRD